MRSIIKKILRALSVAILKKYRPEVIGITGSVGKTSCKEAVYSVLSGKFKVRRNVKNYNNEIGVPLTIIGTESGDNNPFLWLGVFFKALNLILFASRDYPKILVMEMGADHPGDIKYLVDLAKCKIGVITAIGSDAPVHLEFFGKLEKLILEKSEIISHLAPGGFAVINRDDEYVYPLKNKTRAKVVAFGFHEEAEVRGSDVKICSVLKTDNKSIPGISFKLNYKGSVVPLFLPGVLGKHQAYAALAAAAVGFCHNLNAVEVSEGLKKFQSPPGRMNLIQGIKRTIIIDDSYNSSPLAALAALDVLFAVQTEPDKKKYAVLGDMAELGKNTEKAHYEVGKKAAETADILITVGEKGKLFAKAARENNMPEDRVFEFSFSGEAGLFLQERIEQGDIILIKGSQSVRMEKAVKEIMAEPLKAKSFLVRQDEAWVKNM